MSLIERMKSDSCGSLTIETTISLPVFIFAFLLLISYANQARTESIVQHALSQTAKDFSTYLYLTDKVHFPEYKPIHTTETLKTFEENFHALSNLPIIEKTIANPDSSTKEKLYPIKLFSSLINQTVQNASQKMLAETFIQPYCQSIFLEKILMNSSKAELDKYLESLQIDGGRNGLDFSNTTILTDGRTLKVELTYRVKSMFSIIFNKNRTVRQSAITSAWIRHPVFEEENKLSKWKLGSLSRGRAWLEELRKENSDEAVAPGIGVDLYSNGNCTFVYSINLFSSSFSLEKANNQTFELKEQNVKEQLAKYADKTIDQTNRLPAQIEMSNGKIISIAKDTKTITIQMIAPEEAAQFKDLLYEISNEIRKDRKVTVIWDFREKAL